MTRCIMLLLLAAFGAVSCGNQNPAGTRAAVSAPAASADDHAPGTGMLTYTMDGTKTSLKGGTLYINKAYEDPAGMIRLGLTNTVNYNFFEFKVGSKGTTNVLHYRPSLRDAKVTATYLRYKGAISFYGDNVTVTITALDATHLAGTFSGSFVADDNSGTVTVTDGAFDLPITKGD